MKYAIILALLLAGAIFAAGCTSPGSQNSIPTSSAQTSSGTNEIVVHALAPVTGELSPYGESSTRVLRIAESDINTYYSDIGNPTRVRVVIHDTMADPATSRRLAEQIRSNGTRFIIGFLTSAELVAMKPYTDANGMIVLATVGTSPALAIPGDSIYRMQSDDEAQGKVMAFWLSQEKIRAIVPVWRGEIYGDNLTSSTRDAFSAQGGVTLDGIRYDPGTENFSATASSLDVLVGKAISTYGEDSVGVYAVTFNEIADIMNASAEKPNLSKVRWFGSDGNSGNPDLTGASPVARFAAQVHMTSASWGIPELGTPSETPAVRRVIDRIGSEPDGNVLVLYDMLFIAGRVQEDAANATNQSQLARSLTWTCDSFRGISRDFVLNAAGDRELASYDLKRVESGPAGSRWNRVAQMVIWLGEEKPQLTYTKP